VRFSWTLSSEGLAAAVPYGSAPGGSWTAEVPPRGPDRLDDTKIEDQADRVCDGQVEREQARSTPFGFSKEKQISQTALPRPTATVCRPQVQSGVSR